MWAGWASQGCRTGLCCGPSWEPQPPESSPCLQRPRGPPQRELGLQSPTVRNPCPWMQGLPRPAGPPPTLVSAKALFPQQVRSLDASRLELWGHQSRQQALVHGAITRNITQAIPATPMKHRGVFTRSLEGRRPEAGAVSTGGRSRDQRAVPTVPPAQVPVHAPPQASTPSESAEPSLPSSLSFSFLSNTVCSRAPLVGLWESLEGPTVQNRRGY